MKECKIVCEGKEIGTITHKDGEIRIRYDDCCKGKENDCCGGGGKDCC